MGIEFEGFDELEKSLEEISRKAQEMEEGIEVSFNDLFDEAFMHEYTSSNNWDELLDNSGFVVETNEDFENIPEEEWDEYINKTTSFETWEEMIDKAYEIFTLNQLGLS